MYTNSERRIYCWHFATTAIANHHNNKKPHYQTVPTHTLHCDYIKKNHFILCPMSAFECVYIEFIILFSNDIATLNNNTKYSVTKKNITFILRCFFLEQTVTPLVNELVAHQTMQ